MQCTDGDACDADGAADGACTFQLFCEGSTQTTVVDTVAGLPGPGAVVFNGTQTWLPNR